MELNITINNGDDLARLIAQDCDSEQIAHYVDTSDVASNIDLQEIAEHWTTSEIAECFDVDDIAREIDAGDVAESMSARSIAEYVDHADIAKNIDEHSLAQEIDLVQLGREIVGDLGEDFYQRIKQTVADTATDTELRERVQVLEERVNTLLKLLEEVRFSFVCADPMTLIERHPVM